MARRLKVFRTPIGFHDAYVAAPSRKAALAAWGAATDLFARGAAEEVTDPALTEEPLARPGTIVRRTRGTAEEHLAALPPDPAPRPGRRAPERKPTPRPDRPRPDRTVLDAAEQALEAGQRRHADGLRALARRQKALDAERHRLDEELQSLERDRTEADAAYRAALAAWRAA